MSKQYVFRFNVERCIGCYSCAVACKQWHGIKAGTVQYRRVEETATGTFPNIKLAFKSVSCMHCAEPKCIPACPQGAIRKRPEDGIVVVDREKCNGCRECYEACPVHAPQFGEGVMEKCDMCLEEINAGKIPVCAATCPTKALSWGMEESQGTSG